MPLAALFLFIIYMFHVALLEPEIPPNTGNIARLCAASDCALHIVGQPGFRIDDRAVKRAGLDYWEFVDLHSHMDLEELTETLPSSRMIYFSTKGAKLYTDWEFRSGDCLVFGPETRGLPRDLIEANADSVLRIPISNPGVRSLNLATAVGIALYEAIRQANDN